MIPDISSAIPEIFLAGSILFLLMVGAFHRQFHAHTFFSWLPHIALLVTLCLVLTLPSTKQITFTGQFISDAFSIFIKALVIFASFLVLVLGRRSLITEDVTHFEYPILVLTATLGMMVMVSANDLLSLFIGLELQSLSLYIMAAIRREHAKSSEAALKYFVLGALSTGLLLYGITLVYGFSGTTNFTSLLKIYQANSTIPVGVMIGIGLILAGLAFKISAVPFHMWTPDVYEGTPTSIALFIASAPKIAAFGLLTRTFLVPLLPLLSYWQNILMAISIASMILGAFAALNQKNVKRLIAYSSIGNMGYALIGLLTGTAEGVQASLIYVLLYLVMIIGVFGSFAYLTRRGREVDLISDLKGLVKINPGVAFVLAFMLFSMAGIPPLAGFLGKLYIFNVAISAGFIKLAIIGVLTSVIAAAYYLIVIKVMFMEEPEQRMLLHTSPVDRDPFAGVMLTGLVLFLVWFFIQPSPVIAAATTAARSLFQ